MQPWQSPEDTSEGLLVLRPLPETPIGCSACTHHALSAALSGCSLRPALTSQLQAPLPAFSLHRTSGSDLWLVFSSPSKSLGASKSSPTASFGLRVPVLPQRSESMPSRQGIAFPFPPNILNVMDEDTRHRQPQIQTEKVVIWVGSTYFGQHLAQQPEMPPHHCPRCHHCRARRWLQSK